MASRNSPAPGSERVTNESKPTARSLFKRILRRSPSSSEPAAPPNGAAQSPGNYPNIFALAIAYHPPIQDIRYRGSPSDSQSASRTASETIFESDTSDGPVGDSSISTIIFVNMDWSLDQLLGEVHAAFRAEFPRSVVARADCVEDLKIVWESVSTNFPSPGTVITERNLRPALAFLKEARASCVTVSPESFGNCGVVVAEEGRGGPLFSGLI
ncbi:MAG: hypothetical protein Q9208_006894 [Pyrenodesmia sp. 3 TL-2023]